MAEVDNYSDFDLSDEETGEGSALDKQFFIAANHLKTLVSKLDSTKLLELYSYYKQGTEGPCKTPRPKWYDVQGKQKWDTWNALADMPSDEAKERYVKLIQVLDPKWQNNDGFRANSEGPKGDSWVAVSTLSNANEEEILQDNDKTIFDFCKENNANRVEMILQQNPNIVNKLDDSGLNLLHWAADRGYLSILKIVLSNGGNVDILDSCGQTALHYAVSCGHFDCVKYLLDSGAKFDIKDEDENTCVDLCTDNEIRKLFDI